MSSKPNQKADSSKNELLAVLPEKNVERPLPRLRYMEASLVVQQLRVEIQELWLELGELQESLGELVIANFHSGKVVLLRYIAQRSGEIAGRLSELTELARFTLQLCKDTPA